MGEIALVDLFDTLVFPRAFFRKRAPSLQSSFLCFLVIALVNLFSYPYTIQKTLMHLSHWGWFLMIGIPFLGFFCILGFDLILIESNKAQRYSRFFGATYAPFLLMPIAMAMGKRELQDHRLLGWILVGVILVWSSYLFSHFSQRKQAIMGRVIKDLIIVAGLYRWVYWGG